MRKRTVIIPLAILATTTPGGIFIARKLDTSSTAPVININTTDWTNSAIVDISKAASFGGSDLDHYEYCINSDNNIDGCEWKTLTVSNIRIRTSGTSYVWVRGVSQNNIFSEPSNQIIAQVDRTKPDADATLSSGTSSIQIAVSASDDTDIASYMYSINDSDYVKGDAQYTFNNLTANTAYTIKVKITDLANNTKYLSFKQSTNAVASVKNSQSARKSSASSASTHSTSNHKSPSHSSNSKPSAKPSSGGRGQAEENPENTVDDTTIPTDSEMLPEIDLENNSEINPEAGAELTPEGNPNTDSTEDNTVVDNIAEPIAENPTAIDDSSDDNAEATDEGNNNDEELDPEDEDETEESEEDSDILGLTNSTETM